MPEFLKLSTPQEAINILLHTLQERKPNFETISTILAMGRVIGKKVLAPHPLPEFPRSTVDGYALRARETFGASESLPGYLNLVGEIPMGAMPSFNINLGSCALIHTGGMLPQGADAVIMLEYTQRVEHSLPVRGGLNGSSAVEIEISHAVAEGENTLRIGEDVKKDQVVIQAGTRIRTLEIGSCMALGILELRVVKKPKIGILSTGNEVISPMANPLPGQIRDVNSYSLAALVSQAGGEPILYGIFPDDFHTLEEIAKEALKQCDMVLITAGSSASAHDLTSKVITSLGTPGVLVHGVNVRPGKPTILAVCQEKAVIGMPGNPVSALIIAGLFVVPVIEKLLGALPKPKPMVRAKLTVNVPSQAGREDWVAVKLEANKEILADHTGTSFLARPIFAKSNFIFSLSLADGLIRIPPETTGMNAGEDVEVNLF
jgi:molybdopterin molybdotransferase